MFRKLSYWGLILIVLVSISTLYGCPDFLDALKDLIIIEVPFNFLEGGLGGTVQFTLSRACIEDTTFTITTFPGAKTHQTRLHTSDSIVLKTGESSGIIPLTTDKVSQWEGFETADIKISARGFRDATASITIKDTAVAPPSTTPAVTPTPTPIPTISGNQTPTPTSSDEPSATPTGEATPTPTPSLTEVVPIVESTFPVDYTTVKVDSINSIWAKFDRPMDETCFKLHDGAEDPDPHYICLYEADTLKHIKGAPFYLANPGSPAANTAGFKPDEPLKLNTRYKAVISYKTRSAEQAILNEALVDYVWYFKTRSE